MKPKRNVWMKRRVFAEAYACRWKSSKPPSHETCARWARKWETKKISRWVEDSTVGAKGYWEFSNLALEMPPLKPGRK